MADYILKGEDREEFTKKFKNARSKYFYPYIHLNSIGIANQTTMPMSERRTIGRLLENTMMVKLGAADINKNFVAFDTIFDASQERKNAIFDLLGSDKNLYILLLIGSLNSSNTSHL